VNPPARKQCVVAYATAARQFLWPVELAAAASIQDALEICRAAVGESADGVPIPWDSGRVGIFGETRPRHHVCAPGDRIELYRALECDPRARRHERVARERRQRR
jgi:putative ubiquitin-RnfH superfamily antitoxin RatB of RatAB toxin-antitoxin module